MIKSVSKLKTCFYLKATALKMEQKLVIQQDLPNDATYQKLQTKGFSLLLMNRNISKLVY